MNDAIGTLLLSGLNLVFIGLIYLFLFLVFFTVQREVRQHLRQQEEGPGAEPGRLEVIHSGPQSRMEPGRRFRLRSRTNLGSKPGNDIILDDDFVSGDHVQLTWDGHRWWVEDLGSTNGTMLDGRSLPPHVRQSADPHATLEIGDTAFRLLS